MLSVVQNPCCSSPLCWTCADPGLNAHAGQRGAEQCVWDGGKKNTFLHRKCVPKVLLHTAEVKGERIRATSLPC